MKCQFQQLKYIFRNFKQIKYFCELGTVDLLVLLGTWFVVFIIAQYSL